MVNCTIRQERIRDTKILTISGKMLFENDKRCLNGHVRSAAPTKAAIFNSWFVIDLSGTTEISERCYQALAQVVSYVRQQSGKICFVCSQEQTAVTACLRTFSAAVEVFSSRDEALTHTSK